MLAPHVTEHRCEPPESGVTALPYIGDPPGTTGTCVSTATLPGTVTVSVSGGVMSEREVADAIQRQLLKRQRNNWAGRSWPLRTA